MLVLLRHPGLFVQGCAHWSRENWASIGLGKSSTASGAFADNTAGPPGNHNMGPTLQSGMLRAGQGSYQQGHVLQAPVAHATRSLPQCLAPMAQRHRPHL